MGLRDVQSELIVHGQHLLQLVKSQDPTTYLPVCSGQTRAEDVLGTVYGLVGQPVSRCIFDMI